MTLVKQIAVRIGNVFTQPDLSIGVTGVLFLYLERVKGIRFKLPLWFLCTIIAIQILITWTTEYLKFHKGISAYHERSISTWTCGIIVWSLVASQLGGVNGPFFYVCIFLILHHRIDSRRRRYGAATFLWLFSFALSIRWEPYYKWGYYQPEEGVIYGAISAIVLLSIFVYCLFFLEHRFLINRFLYPLGSYGPAFVNTEDLFRSTLARAMRLHRADAGFISVPQSELKSSKDLKLKVLYRAGAGVDDPLIFKSSLKSNEDHDESILDPDNISYKAVKNEIARRFSLTGFKENGIPFKVMTELSFTLKRQHSPEPFAIITLCAKKRFNRLFPRLSLYLNALRMHASTIYEMLCYNKAIDSVLVAKEPEEFKKRVNEACNSLVPGGGRAKIELVISNSRYKQKGAVVAVCQSLPEKRMRQRRLTVSARIKQSELISLRRIRYFLQRAASPNIVQTLAEKDETLRASDEALTGLSNLEPPDNAFLKKISEWDGKSFDYFVNCGFRLLWANQLMHTWNPSITEDEKGP